MRMGIVNRNDKLQTSEQSEIMEFLKGLGAVLHRAYFVFCIRDPPQKRRARRRTIQPSASVMKLALLSPLLLTLNRCGFVGGFVLLSASFLSRSTRQIASIPASRNHELEHVTTMMTSFWEGIVQGVGGEGATSPATTDGAAMAKDKCPVLICPAQLSVPGDYRKTVAEFKER